MKISDGRSGPVLSEITCLSFLAELHLLFPFPSSAFLTTNVNKSPVSAATSTYLTRSLARKSLELKERTKAA